MRIPPIDWTPSMIELLYNTSYGNKEVANILGLRQGSVKSKRALLGIKNNMSAVMSKPRPQRYNREIRTCIADNCNNTFEVIKSRTKKYCSHSCDVTSNHRAPKGVGSRSIRNPNIKEYKKYVGLVHRLTSKIYEANKEIINPHNHPRTLCGVEGGWQLDHIVSIKECFEKGLTIEDAAELKNLRMLPWRENLMRNFNC